MMRSRLLCLSLTSSLGCSVVLDPDGLAFPEGDVTFDVAGAGDAAGPADTLGSSETSPPTDSVTVEDATSPDTSPPSDTAVSDVNDVTNQSGVIRVGGGSTGCEVAYRIAPALPLVAPCAKTCSNKKDGWPVELTFSGPGGTSATWSLEATQGVVATPASGTGAALSTVLTFGEDNCGNADAVPDFTLLATVKAGGVTTKATFDFDTTLDGGCPALTCE